MLLNLIVNAAEAMHGKGELRLGVRLVTSLPEAMVLRPRHAEPCVLVEVVDSGPGMPPGVKELVFEPFFTTKHTNRKPGTGLGLSMVHDLAVQEGFGLALEGAPGCGAIFHIYIPRSEVKL